jgi:uncharacterized protein
MGNRLTLPDEVQRRAAAVALQRAGDVAVVVLNGPRSVGKSTALRQIAGVLGSAVIDLDDPTTRLAVAADPTRFLHAENTVLIDEYARVPELLDVIKNRLNSDGKSGQFILAGSTRYGSIPAVAQALTGRVELVPILPLSQGEISQSPETFLERLLEGTLNGQSSNLDRSDYATLACAGGFPLALRQSSAAAQARWFDSYVALTIQKDVTELARIRQRAVLPRLAEALAGRTAQLANTTQIALHVGLERSTAEDYIKLLEAVFFVHMLPAWGTTLNSRSGATPKVHLTDAGLAARLLRVTPTRLVAAHATSLQQFGHLLETFVVNEILKQVSWLPEPLLVGHWRTHDDEEVDLVLETSSGEVWGVEVKASPRVRAEDFKGLRALARKLGSSFAGGLLLHTGPLNWAVDDQIRALPIEHLWTTSIGRRHT